ncbi:MAG: hypothetical protein IKC19_04840, partial [Bacteroidales bacterium]|nr:hypothetical protein [Bacteroidales bacterium]
MKETNKSLLAGLAVVIVTVGVVMLVGLLAIHPEKEIISGEVDAADLREQAFACGGVEPVPEREDVGLAGVGENLAGFFEGWHGCGFR